MKNSFLDIIKDLNETETNYNFYFHEIKNKIENEEILSVFKIKERLQNIRNLNTITPINLENQLIIISFDKEIEESKKSFMNNDKDSNEDIKERIENYKKSNLEIPKIINYVLNLHYDYFIKKILTLNFILEEIDLAIDKIYIGYLNNYIEDLKKGLTYSKYFNKINKDLKEQYGLEDEGKDELNEEVNKFLSTLNAIISKINEYLKKNDIHFN